MLGTSIDLRGDDFDAAIARVTEALAAEGFGVIIYAPDLEEFGTWSPPMALRLN